MCYYLTKSVAIKSKFVIILESIIILALISVIIFMYKAVSDVQADKAQNLLSPKIYAGIDEPKSFTILDYSPLQKKIEKYLNDNNLNASVYVKNYRNSASMGIRPNEGYFPASLNKLPVAILIMEKIENGDLTLDTMLNITDSERTNSSGDLHKTKYHQLPLRIILEKMLKDSDNTAFYVLLEQIDPNDFKMLLDYMGIDIYANYHTKAFSMPKNSDYLSPRLMSNIFASLYFSTVLEPKDSQYILSLLTDTVFDIKKYANLPDKVIVSQKFGQYYSGENKFFHSCGIMYIDKSRIFFCIMTKDLPLEEAKKSVGEIAHEIYQYVIDTRAKLDQYKLYVENS